MTRPVFSIVCVYNNEQVLNDWLMKGLKTQDSQFELVLVDNTGGKFKSAAEGLNYGGAKAEGEYIVFIHQDVRLLSADWLRRAEAFLRELPDLGVAGVAGMIKGRGCGFFRVGTVPLENKACFVFHGPEKKPVECGRAFSGPVEVQTLDEQVLIVPRKVFLGGGFDDQACSGWHLYGVDYSLSVKKRGLKACALPIEVWHMSAGALDEDYYATLNKILKKHSSEDIIYTTCGLWYTPNLFNWLDLFLLAVKSQIGRWLGRNDYGAAPFLNKIRMLLRKRASVTAPAAAVVIVNWNGIKFLENCFRSVFAQTYADYKVVFVDNGSTDGSIAFVKENYPRAEIIALDKNYGFSVANNMAMRKALEAGAEYIALLNNDTKAATNWLAEMASVMGSDPGIGICASKMLRMDEPRVLDSTGHIFIDGIIYDRGGGEPDKGQYDDKFDVAGACAGACLYRGRMLETIGFFDEGFGSYYEDAELSWRAYNSGWKAKYVPAAVVYHKRYGTSKGNEELRAQIAKQGNLNLIKAVRRHASLAGKLRLTIIWLKEAARQRMERSSSGKAAMPDYLEMAKSLWFKKA